MAISAIWIAVASIVATFDITKAVDENGDTIEPVNETRTGLAWSVFGYNSITAIVLIFLYFSIPMPFKCSIKPRSENAEILIRSTAASEF